MYCGLCNVRPMMLEQLWFEVQVAVCGVEVIQPELKSRLCRKFYSANTSHLIILTVTGGMNAEISNLCEYV